MSHLTIGFNSQLLVIFEGENGGGRILISYCEAIWCVQLCEKRFPEEWDEPEPAWVIYTDEAPVMLRRRAGFATVPGWKKSSVSYTLHKHRHRTAGCLAIALCEGNISIGRPLKNYSCEQCLRRLIFKLHDNVKQFLRNQSGDTVDLFKNSIVSDISDRRILFKKGTEKKNSW